MTGALTMKAEFEKRACQLLRTADIFHGVQIVTVLVGVVCARLFGNGIGVIILFAQCVAVIIFLIVFSWKSDSLIRPRYPHLEPLKYQNRSRMDVYTPALRNAAILSDDTFTVKLLDIPRPIMLRAFAFLVIAVIADGVFSG